MAGFVNRSSLAGKAKKTNKIGIVFLHIPFAGDFMLSNLPFGPLGVVLVGIVIFFGAMALLRRRERPSVGENPGEREKETFASPGNGTGAKEERLEAMIRQLDDEKRTAAAMIRRAEETTRHLERMIDSFEKTFYSGKSSVANIFDDLRKDLGV